MKAKIVAVAKLRNQLGTDKRIKQSHIYFNTIPSIGEQITLKSRKDFNNPQESKAEFKIIKRIFFDREIKTNNVLISFDFKLVLEPVEIDYTYDRIYFDCNVSFRGNTLRKSCKDSNTVKLILGSDEIPYSFIYLPNTSSDYISVGESYCKYINTIYDKEFGETKIIVEPGYFEDDVFY